MREAKARECRCVVEDCGLVLCAEAGGEGVAGLGGGAVHAVDEWGDGGGEGGGSGWGEWVRGGEGVECWSWVRLV